MKPRLTDRDYMEAARELQVDVASIHALVEVESRGNGFLATGEPVILFERHWMHRLLRRKGITPPPNSPVAQMKAGGYLGGIREHARLQEAVKLDRESALQSASWGLFQIMGFHWELLGYTSVQGFINDAYHSEGAHLKMFVKFVQRYPGLWSALKAKDWFRVAHIYNGPAHAKNNYGPRLTAAYAKWDKRL